MRNSQRKTKTIWWGFTMGLALILLALAPQMAAAQWATNGNNINNTNSGNVGIGNADPITKIHSQVVGGYNVIFADTYSANSAIDAELGFRKSHSNAAANTATQDGESLGVVGFWGNTGSSFQQGAFIQAFQQGVASTYIPTMVKIRTSDGSTYALDRFVIDKNGYVGIGTTNPGSKLYVVAASSGDGIRIEGSQTGPKDPGYGLYDGNTARGFLGLAEGVGNFSSSAAVGDIVLRADTGKLHLQTGTGNAALTVSSGKVGIGATSPTEALDVVGNIKASGTIFAKYQDVAEWVPSSEKLTAGTVVVLDSNKSNQVVASTVSYDTRVAGVISAQPGITLGEKSDEKVLVATTGRVGVRVDASKSPIQIGDLLVTSDISGVAMKSEPVELGGRKMHMPGTIIGKALEPLAKGSGEILVLLSLQ